MKNPKKDNVLATMYPPNEMLLEDSPLSLEIGSYMDSSEANHREADPSEGPPTGSCAPEVMTRLQDLLPSRRQPWKQFAHETVPTKTSIGLASRKTSAMYVKYSNPASRTYLSLSTPLEKIKPNHASTQRQTQIQSSFKNEPCLDP